MRAHPGRASSIQLKAQAVVFSLTAVLVTLLATYFPARHIDSLRRTMRDKAATYARLVAKQVEPGVAFDDSQTVREVFSATAADEDVRGMALYDARGRVLFALGDFAGPIHVPPGRVDGVSLETGSTFLRATTSVVSREGPTGTLVLEIATTRLEQERGAVQRAALAVGACALLVGFVAAWLMGRSLGRRLGVIANATRAVAAGDLTVRPVHDPSSDEVGQLATSFNTMFANIRALLEETRESNARETERLDGLVRARTRELDDRNRDMRIVLDNVNQGLLVIESSGFIAKERSAVVAQWFGEPDGSVTFWQHMERFDARAAVAFQLNWEALLDGTMPAELCLDQLPHRLRSGELEYELDYIPLLEGRTISRLLVVISDITRRRMAERAEAEQREVVCAFGHVVRDRTGFLEFMAEARSLVDRIGSPDRAPLVDVKRWLHTLKGNASLFGLTELASMCHELEDVMADSGGDLTAPLRESLRTHWHGFAGRFRALLGAREGRDVHVDEVEYQDVFEALLVGRARREIASMVAVWKLEPASDRLGRQAVQARALAERMGRTPIDVTVDATRLRLSREALAAFWSAFAHAVRNAVAHGIESPAERAEANKPAAGRIRMRAWRAEERVFIEIEDDGRGIGWKAVERRAREMGLACGTQAELGEALFCDGLSTRTEVDGFSGRGVGMGALRAECERLGGGVTIQSTLGLGTAVRFSFAADLVCQTEETRRASLAGIGASSRMMSEPLLKSAR